MNIVAIDIGNSNITIGLFLDDTEKFIEKLDGNDTAKLAEVLKKAWNLVPVAKMSKEKKRDGVIVVGSVKKVWTKQLKEIAKKELNEKVLEIGHGKNIPLPMVMAVDKPEDVGVDRILTAFAAYTVVGDTVAIADFGTAVTIDIVDEKGVFLGGTIIPGFDTSARALKDHTAALPKINEVKKPKLPYGTNTKDAINNGLYFAAVGVLENTLRAYADELGKWPQAVVTGGAMNVIEDDCGFADSFVADLSVKGIVLTYKKYIEEKTAI
ncbi:MAG: type III pantothenate kinase [Planctomycetes bacterium]|nr:type III pantothenate kinase [Planctomycetota bacterium]